MSLTVTPSITCPRCGWRLDDRCDLGRVAGVRAYYCRAKLCGVAFAKVGGTYAIAFELDHDAQRKALEHEIPRIQAGEDHLSRMLFERKRV